MVPHDRRSLLASLGAGSVSIAGCLTGDDADGDAAGSDETSDGGATRDEPSEADSTGEGLGRRAEEPKLRLTAAGGVPTDRPVRVHPRALADLLERGATTGDTVRTVDRMLLEGQSPVLASVGAVRLAGEAVEDGPYALALDGGPRYEWLFGATAVEDPPADAEVVAVDDLWGDRRSLALEAIHDGRPRAYPETPLGTWARTAFVGGYVRDDGTVYRGREVQQTDAGFFATEAWYVGTVAPTDEAPSDAPRLLLDPLPDPARDVVDDLLAAWAEQLDPVEASIADLEEPARAALAETDAVLAHVDAFEVTTA